MAGNKAIYTRKIIAQLLNLSEKRIKQLAEEGIIEEYSPGHFLLVPAIQGYVKYLQKQLSDDNVASDYNTEKAMLTKVKRLDAELDLKVKKNELHKGEDVEFILTNMLIAFKSKMQSLPYNAAKELVVLQDTKDKEEIMYRTLKRMVDEALSELAGYNPEQINKEAYIKQMETD